MPDDRASPPARPAALVPVPDLAGTPAADASGRFFGEIYGSLAEAGTGLIRYLDLDLHGAGRHVLVPIGHVRVARAGEPSSGVRLRAASAADLRAIPPYQPGAPGAVDEAAVLAAHGRLFAGEQYYAHPAFDHRGLYAGDRPIVRAPPGAGAPGPSAAASRDAAGELAPLSSLPEYELAEGEPDVRGWPLVTREGARPGTIDDLVVEPAALQARYLVVGLGADARVLVPIGYVRLDADARAALTPALSADDITALPLLSGAVERADEEAVRAVLESRLDGERRYQRADFQGSGAVQAAGAAPRSAKASGPGPGRRGAPAPAERTLDEGGI